MATIPTKFLLIGGGLIAMFILAWASLQFTQKKNANSILHHLTEQQLRQPVGAAAARGTVPGPAAPSPEPSQAQPDIIGSSSNGGRGAVTAKDETDMIFRKFWESQIPHGETEYTWIK